MAWPTRQRRWRAARSWPGRRRGRPVKTPGRAAQLANFACGFCAEAAREASYRSLHYHGGYGFMLEFDIQLFFRRAKAWPAVFAEPSQMFARGEIDRLSTTRAGG